MIGSAPRVSPASCSVRVDAITKAALWLSVHRDAYTGALIPVLRARFSLSALEAIEALKQGNALCAKRGGVNE